jgi:small subunit ribosomal protein S19
MSRSSKKGPYIDPRVMKKVMDMKASGKSEPIKTWSRSCTIAPEFVGVVFMVHNGKDFISFTVDEEKVGHKLGEFSHTTKFRGHGGKGSK